MQLNASLRHHGCRISALGWRGHTVVTLENSHVRFSVIVSRGAEISEFRFKPLDLDVLWHSERSIPERSTYFPATAVEADTFFDHYVGGWQESFPVGNSRGVYNGAHLGLHGEVSLLPWEYRILNDDRDQVKVEFHASCRRTPFTLTRRMSLRSGSTAVVFQETIRNTSPTAQEYAWGHHPAFGAPFLTPACVLDLPRGTYRTRDKAPPSSPLRYAPGQKTGGPRLAGASGGTVDVSRAHRIDAGCADNFYIELGGRPAAAIRNPKLNLGVGLTWNAKTFPYLWHWAVGKGAGGYPLWGREYLAALEPFNCPIGGLVDLAGSGILPKLPPYGQARTQLTAGFCGGRRRFDGTFI